MKKIKDVKAEMARKALEKRNWNFRAAARDLGMSGQGLHLMARRAGLIVEREVKLKRWVRAA